MCSCFLENKHNADRKSVEGQEYDITFICQRFWFAHELRVFWVKLNNIETEFSFLIKVKLKLYFIKAQVFQKNGYRVVRRVNQNDSGWH